MHQICLLISKDLARLSTKASLIVFDTDIFEGLVLFPEEIDAADTAVFAIELRITSFILCEVL
jgi:hypothetical protein